MLGTYVVSIHRATSRHEQCWWILCRNLTQSSLPMRLAKGAILFLDQEEACVGDSLDLHTGETWR